MESNNNNNAHSSSITIDDHEDHATVPTTTTTKNLTTVATHPLQDVPLTMHENISEMQQQKVQRKENWVKFDDEVNEISRAENNFNNNNNNNYEHDQTDSGSSAVNVAKAAAAAATSTANKLSTSPTALLPPPPQSTRPRTPSEREKQMQRESLNTSPLNVVTPAQRSIASSNSTTANISPDVAPAVLTTESTHVNLNASGKTQQQQSTLPQHLQQQQKLKATSLAGNSGNSSSGSNQQQHQAHHTQLPATQHHNSSSSNSSSNNNGTATATPATNNAMHHKSHHQHHYHQTATTSSPLTTSTLPVEATTSLASTTATATATGAAAAAATAGPPAMRTIELSTGRIREGFANGDVIVTLLPANTKWPWITPAIFRPELVPEELMAQGLTLTVEEYVQAMETLVNDYRFTVYNICYKRVLVCWILFAFTVLLTLLFSGLQGVALFSLGVSWLFLNAAAIFVCMWVKLRLSRGLEKCLARVNRQLMKHKILLILDDRGRISCHKVNLCFLYFDAAQCVNFLNEFLEQTERNGGEEIKAGWESKLDIDLDDIVIQGTTPVRLSRKQAVAQEIFLTYLQRWGKDFLRRRLDWTIQEAGVHESPRHLQSSICPCQYEEELLRNKIKMHLKRKQCCGINCLGCWL